jgi:hypothetical protein
LEGSNGSSAREASFAIGVWTDPDDLERFGSVNVADRKQSVTVVVEVFDED